MLDRIGHLVPRRPPGVETSSHRNWQRCLSKEEVGGSSPSTPTEKPIHIRSSSADPLRSGRHPFCGPGALKKACPRPMTMGRPLVLCPIPGLGQPVGPGRSLTTQFPTGPSGITATEREHASQCGCVGSPFPTFGIDFLPTSVRPRTVAAGYPRDQTFMTTDVRHCHSCGAEGSTRDRFCTVCGASAALESSRFCRVCGSHLELDRALCATCGSSVGPTPLVQADGSSAVAWSPPQRRFRWPIALGLVVVIAGLTIGWSIGDVVVPSWVPFVRTGAKVEAASSSVTTDAQPTAPTSSTAAVAPTTALPPSSTMAPETTTTLLLAGDLGLSVPITRPECDGSYATFLAASVEPDRYVEEITRLLRTNPGSGYLRTDVTCPSLRPVADNGEAIYAVYLGPFATFSEACDARFLGPSGSYVKRLDRFSDPTQIPDC